MIRVNEIKLDLNEDKGRIPVKTARRLGIPESRLISCRIFRESIDARNNDDIKFVYSVDVEVANEAELLKKSVKLRIEKCTEETYRPPAAGANAMRNRPVIVGFGPCGMFAALILAEQGYRPIVIERGKPMDQRTEDVKRFWKNGILDPESNVQFGEGGAGAFSDGKLTTQIRDHRVRKVLIELAAAGGPEEILYKQKPHIGTDILRGTVVAIREKIIRCGGEIRFSSRLSGIIADGIRTTSGENTDPEDIPADAVILAIGHSARDTMAMLNESGLAMERKPFSIGVRIEHPQSVIDRAQYGRHAGNPNLGPAEYKLSHRCGDGRGVYTFCMCPGGLVIGAASEDGGVVTNGMSYHSRNAANANSAVLVDVRPEDFPTEHPLAGIEFQRVWEKKAFTLGGSSYKAPAQRIGDFLGVGEESDADEKIRRAVTPTYQPGVVWADLHGCLPAFASKAIEEALPSFGRKIDGFCSPDAVMTGVETRSSSPVRIIRDPEMRGSIASIYPAGEGAGYAGGIVSAAVDGIRAAEAVIGRYAPSLYAKADL